MSCHAFLHVLVLLDDDERAMFPVLDRAIELAEVEHARLTIAKTTDPGRIVRWFGPMAMISRGGPMIEPPLDCQSRALDCAAAYVPASIPLTRVLLGSNTGRALRRLAQTQCYDLLIVREGFAAHNRRLRKEIRALGLSELAVHPRSGSPASVPASGPAPASTPSIGISREDVLEHHS